MNIECRKILEAKKAEIEVLTNQRNAMVAKIQQLRDVLAMTEEREKNLDIALENSQTQGHMYKQQYELCRDLLKTIL